MNASIRNNLCRRLWPVGLLMLLGGCAALGRRDEPVTIDALPQPRMPAVAVNGAIYSAGTELSLFEDIKARRVGDILTVMLVEQNAGTKAAGTNLTQNTALSLEPPLVGITTRTDIGLDVASNGSFAGESGSSQSNSLTGAIAVTVVAVLAGGNLQVQGEKWIEINQGKEYIRLDGIIRPRDVRPNNTILSTQVADARISYSGTGATENANVIGWAARLLFSALKPF